MNEATQFFEECEEHRELLRDIFVCVPARPNDGLAIDLSKRLSLWHKHADIEWDCMKDPMQGFIEITRAKMAVDFLKHNRQLYVLMIDNDVEPPLRLPYLLARHQEAIVGSSVPSMGASGRGQLCFSHPDKHGKIRLVDIDDPNMRLPATGLLKVHHVGTGALLIRRDVLEAFTYDLHDIPFLVPDRIRALGATEGIIVKGEDLWFCEQARAKGFEVHVDLEAQAGHRKSMRLALPADRRDPSLRVDQWINSDKGLELSG